MVKAYESAFAFTMVASASSFMPTSSFVPSLRSDGLVAARDGAVARGPDMKAVVRNTSLPSSWVSFLWGGATRHGMTEPTLVGAMSLDGRLLLSNMA